ncbi:DUF2252 family protein [Caulobacter sp. YL-Caulobacter]|uniref:DUF2252 family protein n=1 Tax=Caulobacter sp. TaxID=78 RepID=UPI0017A126A3
MSKAERLDRLKAARRAQAAKPDERGPILARTRNLKMARSAHAYVRGSTVKFYEWLETRAAIVPSGPPVWICGDCHLGNLGPLANPKGRVDIQIRDLDQTVVGNPAHDLIRLGLSLASAARGSDLPGVITAQMLEAMIEGYEEALAADFDQETQHPPMIGAVLRQAERRTWKHLANDRLAGVRPEISIGKHFWPITRTERHEIEAICASAAVRDLVTSLKSRGRKDEIRMLDAAYWVKGCSSLGRLRFAVLLEVDGGDGPPDICFLDIKEAIKAAAPRQAGAAMPRGNAERVVAGAMALSPNLGQRMAAGRLLDKAVFVRELMPQDMKLEVVGLAPTEAMDAARSLARVVGDAHGRQMDAATRKAWIADLARNRSGALDAPSWLWSSVVDLMAVHEAAYLEHCRRYALALASDNR